MRGFRRELSRLVKCTDDVGYILGVIGTVPGVQVRTSLGPNRAHKVPAPLEPEVSLCVVTHYTKHPWHKTRMPVVQLCISSMLSGARGHNYELIIWDNGSTPEFRDVLREYKPTVLVESENIGGYNGRRAMLGMARGKYSCITDDDILFAPNWLFDQMKIARTFPNTVANGVPRGYTGVPLALAGCDMYTGKVMPSQWRVDLKTGGVKPQLSNYREYLLERNGVRGWLNITDMQMLGLTADLRKLHEPYCEFLGTSGYLCSRMQSAGFAQAATFRRTAAHIGNVIDKSIIDTQVEMAQKPPAIDMNRMTKVLDNGRKIFCKEVVWEDRP